MLWIKAFHIIFVITWFAALFYLPRLFVYHALAEDVISQDRFKIMERKLYYGIMTPSAVLTLFFGGWLLIGYWWAALLAGVLWLWIKLVFVFLLFIYHFYCGQIVKAFKYDRNVHSHVFYRWLNELPAVILIVVVLLVELQPG